MTDWRTDERVLDAKNQVNGQVLIIGHPFTSEERQSFYARVDALCAAVAKASRGGEDTARLDWLERAANGAPIEVDAFTGMNRLEEDQVFLTTHDSDPTTGKERAHRRGQGSTLRAAIDAARAAEEGKKRDG